MNVKEGGERERGGGEKKGKYGEKGRGVKGSVVEYLLIYSFLRRGLYVNNR